MKTQHTKGPWTAVCSGMDARVRCSDGRQFLVGDIIYHEDNKANAHLIAAAPELLDALKVLEYAALQYGVLRSAETPDDDAILHALTAQLEAMRVAQVVIAKAEGR